MFDPYIITFSRVQQHHNLNFQENGGGTIVEQSTYGLQRDIQFLKKLSQLSGIHVVAGTGTITRKK